MIKNIYLHIGLHKTGSTSIQVSLGKSAEYLRANGYLYPVFQVGNRSICNHSIPFFSMFCDNPLRYHINISWGYTSNESIAALHESYIEQLKSQLDGFEGENLIISGEDISMLNKAQLEKLKCYFYELVGNQAQISIIAMVRNPLNAMQSRLQEIVKHGASLAELCNNPNKLTHVFFQRTFSSFVQAFGKNGVILIMFEDALKHANGPVGYFLDEIGFDKYQEKNLKIVHANKAISHEALVLLSAINRLVPAFCNGMVNPVRNGFDKGQVYQMPGQKIVWSENLNKTIWDLAEPDMKWLYDNFKMAPFTFSKSGAGKLSNVWGPKTIIYLDEMLNVQSDVICQIACNELYYELVRHNSRMKPEDISRIFIFLAMHKQWLDPQLKLPYSTKILLFIAKYLRVRVKLFYKTTFGKYYGRYCIKRLVCLTEKRFENLQTEIVRNKGFFGE